MLNWANRFNICCFLDNHHYDHQEKKFDVLLAAGEVDFIKADAGNAFEQLKTFYNQHRDWIFGHFSYDLKNETEALHSENPDHIHFPQLYFFVPLYILRLKDQQLEIGIQVNRNPGNESLEEARKLAEKIFEQVKAEELTGMGKRNYLSLLPRFSQQEYIGTIKKLQKHILRGDCYEINFCQEFYSEQARIDPAGTYISLSELSPNPFSAYYKLGDKYCLCASPERFLKKEEERLISQPIKGTSARDHLDHENDIASRLSLSASEKDRAENVMVVDLVRNDLSRICKEGTVAVQELFGVYSFPQVHQMISTVSGKIREGLSWVEAIKASFPMGSMTGAPKKRVMELIEQYERTRRGLFSGAIGYADSGENFDFNVVIRSILYNSSLQYLSYQTGSAITYYADAEKEYEECLLKGKAIRRILEGE